MRKIFDHWAGGQESKIHTKGELLAKCATRLMDELEDKTTALLASRQSAATLGFVVQEGPNVTTTGSWLGEPHVYRAVSRRDTAVPTVNGNGKPTPLNQTVLSCVCANDTAGKCQYKTSS